MSKTQYCPTCGCPVRVGGKGTTKYYVPVLKEKADKLCESAIKVMGKLALRDDPEFAELNKAIDEYEEKK